MLVHSTRVLLPRPANLPRFIADAIERWSRIRTSPGAFPEIHASEGLPAREQRKMEWRRDSRLEAIFLVGQALLLHMDILSLRAGLPRQRADRDMGGLGHKRLAELTGLSPRRLARAIADMVDAGWLTFHQAHH